MILLYYFVVPAKAGIQKCLKLLDPDFRRDDEGASTLLSTNGGYKSSQTLFGGEVSFVGGMFFAGVAGDEEFGLENTAVAYS